MTLPRTPGEGPLGPPPGSPRARPRADCTADSAGGLTFDLVLPDGSAAGRWDTALLLVRGPANHRAGTTPTDPFRPGDATDTADHWVRLPLFPFGDDRLRAALPSTMTLAEGRWDVYASLGDEEPQRLRPGLLDLRSLGDRDPSAHRTWLGVRIPYAAREGDLAVRAWLRWPHAELRELRIEDGGLHLHGRLYGTPLAAGARLEARLRQAFGLHAASAFPASASSASVSTGIRAPGGGPDFSCTLPFEVLFDALSSGALSGGALSGGLSRGGQPAAARSAHHVWDIWLRPSDAAKPVRVGRILDDVPDKKQAVVYPPHHVLAGTAVPYYTRDNDLAVRLELPSA